MPFALLIVGIIILIAAIRGQTGTLFSLIKSDFTGSGNYLYWVVAILAIGSIGYIKKVQPISDAFLALVLIVFMISNKGFFAQFMAGLQTAGSCPASSDSVTTTTAQANAAAAQLPIQGITMPALGTGQQVPDPFALGPL